QHIVEEHDAIHLLEARRQRMVEARAAEVEALPAEELQSRRPAGDGEVDGEGAVLLRVPRDPLRGHGDLVRHRSERPGDARAALVGDTYVMASRRPGSCCLPYSEAMPRTPLARPGWVVTSLTRSPPSQTSRCWSWRPCMYCRPVRAPTAAISGPPASIREG